MSETSSDDFSDIDYAQDKTEDSKSYGDFSPQDKSPAIVGQLSSRSQTRSRSVESDEVDDENSFGYDEFEAEHGAADSGKPDTDTDMRPESRGSKTSGGKATPGARSDLYYKSSDYDHLTVNNEIRRLFEYIDRFKYNEIELETQLKPFIPDYIPSIGNVDSFLKPTVSTKDYAQQEDNEKMGICYLDEPMLNQSDPSTFYLKLTNESKQVSLHKHTKISAIVDAEKNTNKIRNWIDNFKKIKNKSLSNAVNIDSLSNMPKTEELMQPFINEQLNAYIQERKEQGEDVVPSYKINLPLQQYAKIICNLLDIPVQNDDINTSLHLLFSTYAALQSTS